MNAIAFVLIVIAAAALGGIFFILFMLDQAGLDADPEIEDLVRSARRPGIGAARLDQAAE